ncbi:MAG: tetratricopeptide repeat protein, partial [Acidobacteriota bacterium]
MQRARPHRAALILISGALLVVALAAGRAALAVRAAGWAEKAASSFDYRRAERFGSRALRLNGESPRLRLSLAQTLLDRGDAAGAADLLDGWRPLPGDLRSGDGHVLEVLRGAVALASGDGEGAVRRFERLL